jgi:hypothetical protein
MLSGQLFFFSLYGLYVLGALLFWGLISWALLRKAGYRNSSLWLMWSLMLFTPFGIILFAVLPFPIERQLKRLWDERQPSTSSSARKTDPVEVELNQLKGEMGLRRIKRKH